MKRERIPYDVINTDQGINYSAGTTKLLGSTRGIVSIIMALTIIIDVVIVALLMSRQSAGIHYMMPIITLIIDLAFLVVSAFANFKFRYSNYIWIGYCVAAVILPIASSCISAVGGEVATSVSIAVNIIVHVIGAIMLAIVVIASRKKSNFKVVVVGIIAASVIVLGLLGASLYYGKMGVFGQNSPRTAVYEFKEEDDSYEVKGVLPGNGSDVVINTIFNGKPVSAIDCDVFTAENIKNIDIKGDVKLDINNLKSLAKLRSDLTIRVDREYINYYRDSIYTHVKSYSEDREGCQFAINAFTPNNLEKDEVYVQFAYDLMNMPNETIIGNLTPSIIVKKNSKLEMDKIGGTLNKILNDPQYSDLDWAYNTINRMVLSNQTIAELSGMPILTGNKKFDITFETVYKAVLNQSNDSKYTNPDDWRIKDSTGNMAKYFTASKIKDVYASLPIREGFSVINQLNSNDISDLADFEKVIKESIDLTIMQNWKVNLPNVKPINTPTGGYTYGDKINLTIDAERGDFDYHHTLYSPSGTQIARIDNANSILLSSCALPKLSGEYVLSTYASSSKSSLVSEAFNKIIPIDIKKKVINVRWTYPDNIFSALNKTVKYNLNSNEFVLGDDVVLMAKSSFDCINAGKYNFEVSLTAQWNDKYDITATNKTTFTVLPKEIAAVWTVGEYVYNGNKQAPSAVAYGVLGENLVSKIDGEQTRAGVNYLATATTINTNYKLTNETAIFSIAKKGYTPLWSNDVLTYNGMPQVLQNRRDSYGTDGEAFDQLTVSDYSKNINAGTYMANVSLPSNSNYYIKDGSGSIEYTINKRKLTTQWNVSEFIYDGTSKLPTFTIVGHVNNEENAIRNSMIKSVGNINAGDYTATLQLPEDSNYYHEYYQSFNYSIEKRNLSVSINDKSKIYDGSTYSEFTLDVNNLASTDTLSEVMSYAFSGAAVNAINVGSYEINIRQTQKAKAGNYTINVIIGTLIITKRSIDVTVNDKSKVYDGSTYSEFTLDVSNLASTDTLAEVMSYTFSGAAVSAINVGSYDINIRQTQKAKAGNYTINVIIGTLTITAKPISLVWGGGNEFKEGSSVIAPTVDVAPISGMQYNYYTKDGVPLANKPVTVGEYIIKAKVTDGNYVIISGESSEYKIIAKEVKA